MEDSDKNYFLKVENLDFRFSESKTFLFKDFTLALPHNAKIIGIVGPNGAGKTKLAEILVGVRKTSKARIVYDNMDIGSKKTSQRIKFISMTSQFANSVFIKQSVKDELLFTCKSQNIPLEDFLEDINLPLDQPPFLLSGGQKRKLIFYLQALIDPAIYILDEPTNGFDLDQIKEFTQQIEILVKRGKKILLISHDMNLLAKLVDWLVILEKNSESGSSSIIYNGLFDKFIINNDLKDNPYINVPIELKVYKNFLLKGKLDEKITIKEFLERSDEFIALLDFNADLDKI